ncbi:MAG: patatin-like phospholipase family protein [Acidobacteriota bacterium]
MAQASSVALVLSGGGARGAYQAGALAAIGERCGSKHPFSIITGVSAGAINTAYLAGYRGDFLNSCRDLSRAWMGLCTEKVFRTDFPTLARTVIRWAWHLSTGRSLAPKLTGLLDTRPLREFISGYLRQGSIRRNIEQGALKAAGLTAVRYSTGQTVTFVEGEEGIPMWHRTGRHSVRARLGVDHVLASSALPIIFPAANVNGEYYGDGAIRHNSPLAPAIHLGADKLMAITLGYLRSPKEVEERQLEGHAPPGQILGMIFNAVFLDAVESDAERLLRINRTLGLLPDGMSHPEGLRPIRLLRLRPSRDLGKLSSDLSTALPRSLRRLVGALGTMESSTPDFLSYLLFERPYIERLLELGYQDAKAQGDQIERFLEE